jgi:hypothetical protein
MSKRSRAFVSLIPVALAVAACSSAGSSPSALPPSGGSGSSTTSTSSSLPTTSSTRSGSAGQSGPASTGTGGVAATAQQLGSQMQTALEGTTSVHFELKSAAAGQEIDAQGDEKLSGGKATASTMSMTAASQQVDIIMVGTTAYLKMPGVGSTSKPWALVSQNSSNPTIQAMATSLSKSMSSASLNQYPDLMSAASSFEPGDTTTLQGEVVNEYRVTVDLGKLSASSAAVQAAGQLEAAGITQVPYDIYVDSQNRPLKVTYQVSVQGQRVTAQVTMSKYNAPVTISAPPSSQVSTD